MSTWKIWRIKFTRTQNNSISSQFLFIYHCSAPDLSIRFGFYFCSRLCCLDDFRHDFCRANSTNFATLTHHRVSSMILFIILFIANNVYEVSRLHVACKGIFAYTLVCLHGTGVQPVFPSVFCYSMLVCTGSTLYIFLSVLVRRSLIGSNR